MNIPTELNFAYYVNIGEHKFRISTKYVSINQDTNPPRIDGAIRLEQIVKKKKLRWDGNLFFPIRFTKKNVEVKKPLAHIDKGSRVEWIYPRLNYDSFEDFYMETKRFAIKTGSSFPSKPYAKIFFEKLIVHYSKMYQRLFVD